MAVQLHFEKTLNESEFESYFVNGESCICCFLAEKKGLILGFQALSRQPELTSDWADIATFARVNSKIKGVGTALFERTTNFALKENIRWINATIRADNRPGLGYYAKMKFKDYSIAKDIPLQDGTLVDRISKKYQLNV